MTAGMGRCAIAACCMVLLLPLLASCHAPGADRAARPGQRTQTAQGSLPNPSGAQWQVSNPDSLITIEVLRGGPLARLGHNHVIAVRRIDGVLMLAEPFTQSTFELRLPVNGFTVDEAQLRAKAGTDFATPVPEAARAGTRSNLLGADLLDAAHYADIWLRSQHIRKTPRGAMVQLQIRLRDAVHTVELPLELKREPERLTAGGEITLRQSELGLTPFSAMLGALQVQDAMRVRFHIVARPAR